MLGVSVHLADEIRRPLVLPDERGCCQCGFAYDLARTDRGCFDGACKAGQLGYIEAQAQNLPEKVVVGLTRW